MKRSARPGRLRPGRRFEPLERPRSLEPLIGEGQVLDSLGGAHPTGSLPPEAATLAPLAPENVFEHPVELRLGASRHRFGCRSARIRSRHGRRCARFRLRPWAPRAPHFDLLAAATAREESPNQRRARQ
jgi:hypothetical protein